MAEDAIVAVEVGDVALARAGVAVALVVGDVAGGRAQRAGVDGVLALRARDYGEGVLLVIKLDLGGLGHDASKQAEIMPLAKQSCPTPVGTGAY